MSVCVCSRSVATLLLPPAAVAATPVPCLLSPVVCTPTGRLVGRARAMAMARDRDGAMDRDTGLGLGLVGWDWASGLYDDEYDGEVRYNDDWMASSSSSSSSFSLLLLLPLLLLHLPLLFCI